MPLTEQELLEYLNKGTLPPTEAPVIEPPLPVEEDEKDRSFSSAFLYGLDMPLENIGETLNVLGAKDAGKWIKEITEAPENYVSATEEFMNLQDPDFFSQRFGKGRWARSMVEQSGQLIGSLATRLAGVGVMALPVPGARPVGAAMAIGGPGVWEFVQQLGPIVQERLRKDGREGQEPTWKDWTIAASSAGVSGALNAFGIRSVGTLNREFVKSVAKAAGQEAITEATQEAVTEVGSGILTEEGLPPARQIAKQAYGAGLIAGPTAGGVQVLTSPIAKLTQEKQITPITKDELDQKVEEETQRRIAAYGDLTDLNPEQLEDIIEDLGYTRRKLPGEDRESLANEVRNFTKQSVFEEFIEEEQAKAIGSVVVEPTIRREQLERFNAMSPEELATFVEEQIGLENYGEWANNQGSLSFNPDISAANNYQSDKEALASYETSRIMRDALMPFKLDRNFIENYAKELVETQSREQLLDLAGGMHTAIGRDVEALSRPQLEKMTNEGIATEIAGMNAMIENQREKFRDLDPDQYMTVSLEKEDLAGPSPYTRMLEKGSNARSAVVETAEGIPINYIRSSLQGRQGDNIIPKEGDTLVVAEQQADARTEALFEDGNITVGEPIANIDPAWLITKMDVPMGTFPTFDDKFFNKMLGQMSIWAQPYGPLGFELGERKNDLEREIRAMKKMANNLAYEYEKGVVEARKQGLIENKDEADRLGMAYLRQFGTRIPLDKEAQARAEKVLEEAKEEWNLEANIEARKEIQEEINEIEMLLEGVQKTPITLEQLPEPLVKPLVKIRKTVDSLTKRMLKEFDKTGQLTPEMKLTLESQLGRYLTGGFKMFEPQLGWNPRFTKHWNKKVEELYQRAITQVQYANKDNPHFTRRRAERFINELLKQGNASNAAQLANLPGILTARNDKVNLENPGRLLETRGRIPYALKKLMGEIDAPDQAAISSISRVAQLVSMMSFYNDAREINEMPGEQWFSPERFGEYQFEIEKSEINPLSGYYTTKAVARELSMPTRDVSKWQQIFMNYIYDPVIVLPKMAVQLGMLILSPATQARNFVGGGIMYIGAGHTLKHGLPEALKMAKHELFGHVSYKDGELTAEGKEAQENFDKLQRLGIINTSVRLNEAVDIFSKIADGTRNQSIGAVSHMLLALKNTKPGQVVDYTVGKPFRAAQMLYSMGDDVWKSAAFGSEKIHIKELLANIQISDDRQNRIDDLTGELENNPGSNFLVSQIQDLQNDINENPLMEERSEEMKLKVLQDYASHLTSRFGVTRTGTEEKAGFKAYKSDLSKRLRNVTNLDDYIDEVAAYHTRMTIPNYDFVGNFAKVWRQVPLGSFIAFPTEIVRVVGNQLQIAAQQGTFKISDEVMQEYNLQPQRPVFKDETGKRRLGSPRGQNPFFGSFIRKALMGTAAIYGIGKITQEILQFIHDIDDEELEAASEILPEWAKNGRIGPLSRIGAPDPGFDYTDLTYTLPFEGLARIGKTMQNAIREGEYTGQGLPESIKKGMIEWIVEYTNSYTDTSISSKVQLELLINQNLDTGKAIYVATDDWGEILVDMMEYAGRRAGPGLYRDSLRIYKAAQEGDERYTQFLDDPDLALALTKLMGISASDMKLEKASLPIEINKFIDQMEIIETNISEFRYETADEEDIMEQWDQMQDQFFKEQQQLYFKIQSYIALGVEPKVIRQQLRDRVSQGVHPTFIRELLAGRFTPLRLPPKYEKSFRGVIRLQKAAEKKAGRDPANITRQWPTKEIGQRTALLMRAKYDLKKFPSLPHPWEED